MKNDEWHRIIDKKDVRFWIRDDIERIIQEQHIDRNRFHEFSKNKYPEIIKKFFFCFSDIKNYSFPSAISLAFNRMHFRSELRSECIDCFFRTYSWTEYMKTIKEAIPKNGQKLFLILCEGWVYEGEIDEMFTVLNEVTFIKDFYIVSSKFDWFIAVSDMEDTASIYRI